MMIILHVSVAFSREDAKTIPKYALDLMIEKRVLTSTAKNVCLQCVSLYGDYTKRVPCETTPESIDVSLNETTAESLDDGRISR